MKGKKYLFPKWFKDLIKQQTPSQLEAERACVLPNPEDESKVPITGHASWHSFWKCKSIIDISNSVKLSNGQSNPNQAPETNQLKGYMYNYKRTHTWRNNSGNTPAKLQFYVCIPRYDVGQIISQADAFPPNNNDFFTACATDPALFKQGFGDATVTIPTSDTPAPVKIPYDHPNATPYMSADWCRTFKVKPMKVKWPDGRLSSTGTLDPGQEINYACKSTKPLMVSQSKWALSAGASFGVLASVYDGLRITPLILVKKTGVVTHSDSVNARVNWGFAKIDYITKSRWDLCLYSQAVKRLQTFDQVDGKAGPYGIAFTDPEAAQEVTAQDTKEEATGMDVEAARATTPVKRKKESITAKMARVLTQLSEEDYDSLDTDDEKG